MPDNLMEALDEFIKLDLLNEKYDFDKFTQYIMNKKVIITTKTLLINLYGNNEKCKEQLFLSIWLIYRFSDLILNHNVEIEKTIKHYCNYIVSAITPIVTNPNHNLNHRSKKEIINAIGIYTTEFNKWKVYDKNVSVKEFIERYNNISKSIELVCKDALNDTLQASVLNSLHKQQKDIINLALKYDKKWNADFFTKHYDIIKNIENICNEKYWSLIQTEFNNKNYDMFYKNMDEIKKIIIELNGKNTRNIAIINNTITTNIIKNNLFIYDDDINRITDISCNWYKQFCTYIMDEFKKLSSPIRDVEYDQYLSQLLSITPTNYNVKLADMIKICYKIIDSLYLDLLLFVA
jgi:hypothetical protein